MKKLFILFFTSIIILLFTSSVVFAAGVAGDFNADGKVDGVDYVLWLIGLGKTTTQSDYAAWSAAYNGKPVMAPNGFYVKGNTIYDANGNPKIFRGVVRPSYEWSTTGDHISLSDFQLMKGWGANVIRLPVNQLSWRQNTSNYKSEIAQAVSWIKETGMAVIIDLHWSDQGTNANAAQQKMADTNSLLFWKDIADLYKGDGQVMFELYNEPHDVSCDVWQNGGSVDGWTVAGMQQMYNTIRGEGANNIVMVGGLGWAFDLTCVKTNRIGGFNIVYATHPYNFVGKNTVADWDSKVGFLAATDPVIMTEFGSTLTDEAPGSECDGTFDQSVLTWAEANKISWTAWAWYPGGCGFPPIIKDWSGTPDANGRVVQTYLKNND